LLELIDKGQTSEKHPHPLLFIHGAFHGGWCWDEHFLEFFTAHGFRVVAPSLRGHGSSPAGKPLWRCSISDYVNDVASVASTLTPRPILIGHSMGGFIVQKYLHRNEAPAAVLLASASPRGHLRTTLRFFRQHPWRCSKFALTGRAADLYGGTLAGARDLFFGDAAPDSLIDAAAGRLQPESSRALLFDMAVPAPLGKTRDTAPILVVGGEQDALYRNRDVHATATFYGIQPTFIPGMGHEVMLEPGWPTVADCILSWLAERGL
jgi:pimeloyl-ACP methyl ester carboxylesterase